MEQGQIALRIFYVLCLLVVAYYGYKASKLRMLKRKLEREEHEEKEETQ